MSRPALNCGERWGSEGLRAWKGNSHRSAPVIINTCVSRRDRRSRWTIFLPEYMRKRLQTQSSLEPMRFGCVYSRSVVSPSVKDTSCCRFIAPDPNAFVSGPRILDADGGFFFSALAAKVSEGDFEFGQLVSFS